MKVRVNLLTFGRLAMPRLGWYSDKGGEVGDYPLTVAGNMGDSTAVFGQVPLANGEYVPIQYQYSNRVHGPEDPNTIVTIG